MRQIIPQPSQKTVDHFKQMIKEHDTVMNPRPDDFVFSSPKKRAVKPKWRQSDISDLRPDSWLGIKEDAQTKRSWKFKRVISVNPENDKPFDISQHTTSSNSMSTFENIADDSCHDSFSNSTRTMFEEN